MTGLHIGPYDKLVETYTAMQTWIREQGLSPASKMWETYLSDPAVEKDPCQVGDPALLAGRLGDRRAARPSAVTK